MFLATGPSSGSPKVEEFLFADVGAQANGLPLTILSLLARDGLDPWAEAERLCHISESAATSYLIEEISHDPTINRSRTDVAELAKRLVARLPTHGSDRQLDAAGAGTGFENISIVPLMMVFFGMLTLGLLALLLLGG